MRQKKGRKELRERMGEMNKIIGVSICFLMVLLLVSGCDDFELVDTQNKPESATASPPSPSEKIYSQGIYNHVEYKTSDTDSTICTVIYYEGGGAFIAKSPINIPASKGDLIKVVRNNDNESLGYGDYKYYKVVKIEDKKE